jgi:hypothetical protein
MAALLVLGLPSVAYCLAPAAASVPFTAKAEPASKLAGFNSGSTGAGIQIEVELPGIAPLGDATKGNFIQVQAPYAVSSTETGPSISGTASPAWPGPVAANAGNDLATFSPSIPQALVNALNYPIVARSVYPDQVHVHTSGSYTPPGGAQSGIGTASSHSSLGGNRSTAVLNDTSPLGSLPKSSPLIRTLSGLHGLHLGHLLASGGSAAHAGGTSIVSVGSATTTTAAKLLAGSVVTTARTEISNIVVAGLIKIHSITTVARASTDGKHGHQHTHSRIGSTTVAGLAATIGPKGIKLQKKNLPLPGNPIGVVNNLLGQLQKQGLMVRLIQPRHKVHGSHAQASSGGVQVRYLNKHVPNLQGILPQLPIPAPNAFGLDANFGISQVSANATPLPHITPIHTKAPKPAKSPTTNTVPPAGPPSGSGFTGGDGGLPSGDVTTGTGGPQVTPVVAKQASETLLGVPVKVAWVILALVLSVMLAAPLLAYANWQLLRGRSA